MIKVKAGVQPAHLIIAAAAANVAETLGLTVVITSGTDGKHMTGSRHYDGRALDFRSANLNVSQRAAFIAGLHRRLGTAYDVVIEADHVHVEQQ